MPARFDDGNRSASTRLSGDIAVTQIRRLWSKPRPERKVAQRFRTPGTDGGNQILVGLGVGDWLIDNDDAQIEANIAAGDHRDGSGAWGVTGFLSHETPTTAINLWFRGDDFVTEDRARAFQTAVVGAVRAHLSMLDG